MLNQIKRFKAKDVSECIKSVSDTFLSLMLHICQWKPGYFANAWKSAVITPMFKVGDPTNYRPISILTVIS